MIELKWTKCGKREGSCAGRSRAWLWWPSSAGRYNSLPRRHILIPIPWRPMPSQAHGPSNPAFPAGKSSPATILDATSLGSPILLNKGWRVGISESPAVAAPDFDDSGWAIRDADSAMADVVDEEQPASGASQDDKNVISGPSQRRYAWFRLHLKLAANHGPVSLLTELPVSQNTSFGIGSTAGPGVDVFANGKLVNPEGPHGDAPQHYQPISRLYDLKIPASETSLVLVARTPYSAFGYSSYTSFFENRRFRLGNREDLRRSLGLWSAQQPFRAFAAAGGFHSAAGAGGFSAGALLCAKGPYGVPMAGLA